jgi:ERCC4-type nuclease
MDTNVASLILSATKPDGKLAQYLAQHGMEIVPVVEDEGNVDRYIVSDRLVAERRTSSTFLRGIMDKTLFTSAVFLHEHWELPILIIEGEVYNYYAGFSPQAIRGALTSMVIEYGLNVLHSAGLEETAEILGMLAKQEQTGIPEISMVPKRKADELPDLQRRVIEMLPGSGRVLGKALLRHFGSVRAVMEASEDELRAVKGIGAKTARGIRSVCHSSYEAIDSEQEMEDAIEHSPRPLFHHPVQLLARQHYIFSDERERHIVDLVFLDEENREIVLVELKRGRLSREHEQQLQRYLDHAGESPLVTEHLRAGFALAGMLASLDETTYRPRNRAIHVAHVNREKTIRAFAERNAP